MLLPNGPKIADLRKRNVLTQEALAQKSNLDVRTIQRLEHGEPASAESLRFVAAVFGERAEALIIEGGPDRDPDDSGFDSGLNLKPETSGLRLVDWIVAADKLDFGIAFEPRKSQAEPAIRLIKWLESLNCYSYENVSDYDPELRNSAAQKIEAAAHLNDEMDLLATVKPEGLRLLTGQYTVRGKRWRWDNEMSCWYTTDKQREELLRVVAVRIVPISVGNLRIQLIAGESEFPPQTSDMDIPW
jgi:transcriptional regulator with XRE-family HTH domain